MRDEEAHKKIDWLEKQLLGLIAILKVKGAVNLTDEEVEHAIVIADDLAAWRKEYGFQYDKPEGEGDGGSVPN